MKKEVLSQLDALIKTGQRLIESFRYESLTYESKVPEAELRAFVVSALAAIERIAGKNSQYYENIPQERVLLPLAVESYNLSFIPTVTGVLVALRDAVDQGLLESLESRLRANIHDDFLVQASELLGAGYHVAAMVLIGGVIEDHLQKLVQIQGLTLPKRGSISKYNDLLRKNNVYNQSMWRRIQSIGDLRNEAAHGKGSAIKADDAKDAKDAHTFVQRFITDHPT